MSHITPGHVRAFHAVTSQLHEVTLWSCWVNEEPAVAIVLVDDAGEGHVAVMPLFVAITETMQLRFDGGSRAGETSGGGGPKRAEVLRKFAAATSIVVPQG
jgi:hypothetical protein